MTRIFALALALFSILTCTACGNTLNGVGRDMQGAGQWMEETF